MRYENRLPPEGINTSRVHPLRQFLQLAVGAVVLVVILVIVLQYAGSFAARRIPFSYELRVMERLDIELGEAQRHPQMTAYLNELAARLSRHLPLPDGMSVTVHYDSEEVFNAFATVGGNLLFYRGLLSRMPDENTLAMVMAHEISHVLHRDPVAAVGGGIASTIALLGLTGNAGTGVAGQLVSQAGMLTGVQFTRSMEIAADDAALAAVNAMYGHVNGASTLFELFSANRGRQSSTRQARWLERFLSTHPLDEDRIRRISQHVQEQQWRSEGELTPLPADFRRWLAVD
ncbi:M48 family metalloprotease [Granulosicoccus sp. 3-233]|uniref:M48 family metalloprotease n=1 Tax=Granulosicoccus sp. 3-233 TaxID=3417969 RepID=UPI003D32BFC0